MVDEMVLQTQQWLNRNYGNDARFNRVAENGQTGWPTIYALTRALQSAMAPKHGSRPSASQMHPHPATRGGCGWPPSHWPATAAM